MAVEVDNPPFNEFVPFEDAMRAACSGSPSSLEKFILEYEVHIRRAVRRRLRGPLRAQFDSTDFTQMVWHSLCAHPDSLEHCRTREELLAVLTRMADNGVRGANRKHVLSQKRDLRREQPLEGVSVAKELVSREPPPSEATALREGIAALLKGQAEQVQQVIRLRYEGHSCAEIAAEMGINERTVRKMLSRSDPRRLR